jgi:hypothetical protein
MGRIFDVGAKIAVDALAGKVDKLGMPLIFHSFAVAMRMGPVPNPLEDDTRRAIAVLHDVFEDSEFTEWMIHKRYLKELYGFEGRIGCVKGASVCSDDIRRFKEFEYVRSITSTMKVLTHKDNEPYRQYIARIRLYGQPAVDIKLADISHNTSPERMSHLPLEDQERLRRKYGWAKQFLERWDGYEVGRPITIDVTKHEGDRHYIVELVKAYLRQDDGQRLDDYIDDLAIADSYGHLLDVSRKYYTPGMRVVGWTDK